MGIRDSYTAASVFPTKLLHYPVYESGKFVPVHIQLLPTNACNLDCEFCSCADRNKKLSLSYQQIQTLFDVCHHRGTKAVTITGGGEPLLHPEINSIIACANRHSMKVGLVTNGIALSKLRQHTDITWCRISSSDDRIPAYQTISKALEVNPDTDWAFSHVVTTKPNYDEIARLIDFANCHKFTHVRLVSDLLDLKDVPDMQTIKRRLKDNGPIDDSIVIYQGRKDSTRGPKRCLISLVKPVIAPEGVFPCCGVQYIVANQRKDLLPEYCMGKVEDLDKILDSQAWFDGSVCGRCYYSQYIEALEKLRVKPDHLEFV